MSSPPAPLPDIADEAADTTLSLCALPDEALQRVLGAPALSVRDLGRVMAVSRRLRGSAGDGKLPQWLAVRVVGSLCQWPWLKPDIFQARQQPRVLARARAHGGCARQGGDDASDGDSSDAIGFVPPYALGSLCDARELFDDVRWEAACAAQRGLNMARVWGFDRGAVKAAEGRIEAEWEGMSPDERRVWEDKAAARKSYAARYAASQLDPGRGWNADVLRALLARCPNVHTLRLDFPSSQYDRGYKHLKLQPDDGLLRAICDAWGPNLRLLHLGSTRLSVADMHDVLASCPRLRWLGAGYVVLKDVAGELFRDMEPHANLRSIVLPVAARKHLAAYVDHLCKRCPALKEIDASLLEYKQANLVASCARRAAAAGVRRFMCMAFFQEGGSDGEWGSDGGSVGEYCGDGDVIKYVSGGGGFDEDEDEFYDDD